MAKLFETHEALNSVTLRPRLTRAVVGSALLHVLFAVYVIYVPAVRSMLHLASLFSGVDYVDEDYARTTVRERAVMLDPGGRFQYPPGYFAKVKGPRHLDAAPQQQTITEARSRPTRTPKPRPTPNPTPKPTPRPTPAASPSPVVARATEQSAGEAGAATMPDPATEKALDEQAAQAKIKRPKMVNKKPFLDLLAKANQMKESGELDLSGTITMTVEADRNADGTLSNVFIDDVKGDKKLRALAKEFVAALSASTALSFLEDTRHLRLKINLNQQSITGEIDTQVDSEGRAAELKNGYSGMIALARFARRGKDDGALLNNTTVSSAGKQVTVRFTMGREAATKLLAKQLPSG